jgi:hypothetical protein
VSLCVLSCAASDFAAVSNQVIAACSSLKQSIELHTGKYLSRLKKVAPKDSMVADKAGQNNTVPALFFLVGSQNGRIADLERIEKI